MRLENSKKSFYLKYEDHQYDQLIDNLTKLINHVKKIKYTVYSWYNLVYYMMFEM